MMGRALVGALVLAWMATAGWSQSITWLGTLGGDWSEAYGVSANGAVVVGGAGVRAFRWTASGGMQDLGTLPGGGGGAAYGVSADGAVVVGGASTAAGQWHAFRWTASGGMQDLGTLGSRESAAYGVSADGAVVVGWAENAAGQRRAFRWTASGGMQDLGTLGGRESAAYGVSADGAVVVGSAQNAAGQRRAFRWTASGGIEDLNLTYVNVLSCSVTPGSVLIARAVSSDGRYIVGQGYNAATGREEAFLLDTQAPFSPNGDVNHDGCVDDIDMLGVLFEFGELVNDFNRCVDVNRDGIIDDADLLIVLFNFGNGC
jgi:probable HAF family extracellular repeat protein